jgi:hypothetical protein
VPLEPPENGKGKVGPDEVGMAEEIVAEGRKD